MLLSIVIRDQNAKWYLSGGFRVFIDSTISNLELDLPDLFFLVSLWDVVVRCVSH
jgi:hypothetical protein